MALIGAIRALLRVADLRTMTIVGLFVAPDLFVFSGVNMDLTIIFLEKMSTIMDHTNLWG